MNKKGLELAPFPIIMGIIGAVISWIMSSRMESGIIMKIITVVLTAATCYGLAYFMSNK